MDAHLTLILEFTRARQAAQPHTFDFAPQTYLLRDAGGGFADAQFPWNEELLADLRQTQRPGGDRQAMHRIGEVLRDFLAGVGWDHNEREILAATRAGKPIRLTIRSAAAELYALPWEFVALRSTGQLLGGIPGLLIRYEWPQTAAFPDHVGKDVRRGRVLLAWSAVGGGVPADHHIGALRAALGPAFDPERDVLAHASLGAVDRALHDAARDGPPVDALHLLCHGAALGGSYGLALDDESMPGALAVVDAARVQQVLAAHAGMVRLVVLAACNTGNAGELGNHLGSIAQRIHRTGFRAVVASRYPLSAAGATTFAGAFYRSLASRESLERAFLVARDTLARDPGQFDWASFQLYGHDAEGGANFPLELANFTTLPAPGAANAEPRQAAVEATPAAPVQIAPLAASATGGPERLRGLGPGDVLAERYRLVEPLGSGGFGVVWKADDREGGAHVAVKIFSQHPTGGEEERRRRYFEGATLVSRLRHPAIVRVLRPQVVWAPYVFSVMEFVDGQSLQVIHRGQPMGEVELLRALIEIGEGLEAAHAAHVIHRDVKPGNVMRDRYGRLRLIDFDTAKAVSPERTQTVAHFVSPVYAAPEVLDGSFSDPRADIYALGATAMFLLMGKDPPASRAGDLAGLVAHLPCSLELQRALTTACAREPERRYPDMAALLATLRPHATAMGSIAPAAEAVAAPITAGRSWPARSAFLATAVLGGALAAWGSGALSGGADPSPVDDEPQVAPEQPEVSVVAGAKMGEVCIVGTGPEGFRSRDGNHVVKDVCLDVTEVTVAAFARCAESGKCEPASTRYKVGTESESEYCNANRPDRQDHPVNCVDLAQAEAYCKSVGKRLPTEWEWEWAARGRDEGRQYPWGDDAPSCERAVMPARSQGCGEDRTWPVGSKPKGDSRDGFKDMAGNVFEWTSSMYGSYYSVRGGAWGFVAPDAFQADFRGQVTPTDRERNVGFRCARTPSG